MGFCSFSWSNWGVVDLRPFNELRTASGVPTGDPLLEVVGLVQDYGGEYPAVRGVDLTIWPGEFVALIGENGAGKSTLVKHFNGLLRPTKGEVKLNGRTIRDLTVARLAREVGYVFQNPDHQIFHETVKDEVSFGPRQLGLTREEVDRRVQLAMVAVGLEKFADAYPMSLSRGARQRIAVASVLAMGCRLVILDEPTTGQDYRESREIMNLALELKETGAAVVFITHDMNLVAEYAERVIVMSRGRITADGTPFEVFADEAVLAETHLLAPQIVRVGRHWDGQVHLTVEELADCIAAEFEEVRAVG